MYMHTVGMFTMVYVWPTQSPEGFITLLDYMGSEHYSG